MSYASAPWGAGLSRSCGPRGGRRALEIVGIVTAAFWFWPAAAGYVLWKLMGYPVPAGWQAWFTRGFDLGGAPFASGGFGGSGNRAFDEYRRAEIARLEAERRRLDEEAREFRSFVEELKRAKDREEFDAYMARRRQSGPTTA